MYIPWTSKTCRHLGVPFLQTHCCHSWELETQKIKMVNIDVLDKYLEVKLL